MNPTYVIAIGRFGRSVAARLKEDAHGPLFGLVGFPLLDDFPGPHRRDLLTRFREKVTLELWDLLRAGGTGTEAASASRRLDLVLIGSVLETGAELPVLVANLLSTVIRDEFAVMFPADASHDQRSVWLTVALATPAIDTSAAGHAALQALAALERWHWAGPPRSILNRIFILPQQNKFMPLSAEDLERGIYLFVSAAFGAGLRETEQIRGRLAPPADQRKLLATFAVAAADLDAAAVLEAFAWRSGVAGLQLLAARCEDQPAEERSAHLGDGLDSDVWCQPIAAAKKLGSLDPAEAEALAAARRDIRALVDGNMEPALGLANFRLLLGGLGKARERLRALDVGHDGWLPADATNGLPAQMAPSRAVDAPPPSWLRTAVIGLALSLVIATAAGALVSVATVRSAAQGSAASGPRVTSAGAAPMGADPLITLLWGVAIGGAMGIGWSVWSRSRVRRDDAQRQAVLAEGMAPHESGAQQRAMALESAIALRRRRVTRVAAKIIDDEIQRLEAVRASIREAMICAVQRLKEMGLVVGAKDDYSSILSAQNGLHWALLPASALPLLWRQSQEIREEDEWATRLLVTAWPARGHREDLPFGPDRQWEDALRQQHRQLHHAGVFSRGDLDPILRRQIGAFLDAAPHALELGVTPMRDDEGTPLPLSEAHELLVVVPPDGIGLVSQVLREHSLTHASLLQCDSQRSRVIVFRSAADFDVHSLGRQELEMIAFLAAALWLLPAAASVICAARICRRPDGAWRWQSALKAGGTATLVTAIAWSAIRLFDWLSAGGGPLAWSFAARGATAGPEPLVHTTAWIGLVASALFGLALVTSTLWTTKRHPAVPPPRHPLDLYSAGLACVAALILMATFASGPVELAAALPVDLVAVVPLLGAGLAMHLLAARAPGTEPLQTQPASVVPAVGPAPVALDLLAELQRAAGLGKAAPAFDERRVSSPSGRVPLTADRFWRACGGLGEAPKSLLTALERMGQASGGMLVGDLPPDTERAFVTTLIGLALCDRAARVLLICPDPDEQRMRLLRALKEMGVPPPGLCVAGGGEIKDAIASAGVPALIALELADLSAIGIEKLGVSGSSWLAALNLVVLIGLASLLPINATHLAFTLRRLSLASETMQASTAWVAVGDSTAGTLRFVSQAAALKFDRIPFGAGDTAEVRVFLPPTGADPVGALERCARTLSSRGLEVWIEDAVGELGTLDANLPEARGRISMRVGYTGRCSLALVHDRHLAGLFRSRKNVAHGTSGGNHLACWWVPKTPLSRLLLQTGVLQNLEARRELPSPRLIAGLQNPYLAAEHLAAALREGKPDENSLRRAFGDGPVDDFVATQSGIRREGTRALWNPENRNITRAQVLTAVTAPSADLRRETVTRDVIEVRSSPDGRLLRRVDRRIAMTRYYPRRVLAANGVLYEVGETAVLPGSDHVSVLVADPGTTLNDPDLNVTLGAPAWIGEPEVHEKESLRFKRAVAKVTVEELVRGAVPRGEKGARVTYAPVGAQYSSVACVVSFPSVRSAQALYHVARVANLLLPAHLLVEAEDVEVLAQGDVADHGDPAIVFVDRNIDGIGVAEALDLDAIHDLLRWTWWVLYRCECMDGCEKCSPPEVLRRGKDKQGALAMLGGMSK